MRRHYLIFNFFLMPAFILFFFLQVAPLFYLCIALWDKEYPQSCEILLLTFGVFLLLYHTFSEDRQK